MSATSALRATSAASASTVAATPCAPAPSDTLRPVMLTSAMTGQAVVEHEQEVALAAPHHERLDDVARFDPASGGRLGQRSHAPVSRDGENDPGCRQRILRSALA